MNSTVRNILAVVAGIIIGGFINMGIIMLSGSVIPPPEGVNPADMESLAENMHRFGPQHFIMPFLAHALGTLIGAFIAAKIAVGKKMYYALAIGIFFLLGGIANAFMLPAPAWFIIVDLTGAYIPMAWLGGHFAAAPK